ncbi:MAG: UDP-N-acetylglucosamine 2-epimerase (non-hydrolyzing) [Bacteroidales bacterium]|nr:UDP-N-acetylglucosamine 2-epimerase (non-hydrolyzing) [Bacteroidales bacterium]
MKIVTIVGARPQFVKASVVSRVIRERTEIEEVLVHTGQHYDVNMSDVFFREMDIRKPDYNLNVNGLSHGAMTGQMLEKIEEVLVKEKPDWVLVYGDTDSTLAGALAACKLHIKLAHVEAGLRSFNMEMPEEINRILTDRVSSVLFCPTDKAVNNLHSEGFSSFDCDIVRCGDVMYDAALYYQQKSVKPQIDLPSKYILCTIHRAENTDNNEKLNGIFSALEKISKDIPVVMPIHPRTRGILEKNGYSFENSKICFIDPVGYFEMIWLITNSEMIMTDSGGLQKEAYFFKKKCITLREQTEWVELLECGSNVLAGADSKKILDSVSFMMTANFDFSRDLYGDGKSGLFIIRKLMQEI